MFNPDHRNEKRDTPRVEDTRRSVPPRFNPPYGNWDIPLLLDTIDELHSRIQAVDPGGLRTDSEGEVW